MKPNYVSQLCPPLLLSISNSQKMSFAKIAKIDKFPETPGFLWKDLRLKTRDIRAYDRRHLTELAWDIFKKRTITQIHQNPQKTEIHQIHQEHKYTKYTPKRQTWAFLKTPDPLPLTGIFKKKYKQRSKLQKDKITKILNDKKTKLQKDKMTKKLNYKKTKWQKEAWPACCIWQGPTDQTSLRHFQDQRLCKASALQKEGLDLTYSCYWKQKLTNSFI